MLSSIKRVNQTTGERYDFTILLPTWNNLPYFKLCVRSLIEHSSLPIQIIAIVNEGKDGTAGWLAGQKEIDYIHARENIGICYGLNAARTMAKAPYLVYVNDDMYLLPGWDTALMAEINSIGHSMFMLSATMIEPRNTGNKAVVVADYGDAYQNFREADLIRDAPGLHRSNWLGSTWPPNVMPVELWDIVGGMSIEYSPGFYSDPDFSRKLFEAGVRTFKGIGNSLVYHFGSKSTGRISRNPGRRTFLLKWGISSGSFTKGTLQTGENYPNHEPGLHLPGQSGLVHRIKRAIAAWKGKG